MICLLVLAVIATGAALQALQDVMIPFALAMFLSIALAPVVDWLSDRTRLSRPLSVGITMVLGVLVLAILGGVVARSIAEYQANYGEAAVARFDAKADQLTGFLARFGEGMKEIVDSASAAFRGLLPGMVGILGGALSQGITVLIFMMFLLVEQRRDAPESAGSVGEAVKERVKQYISVKVMTSAATGIGVGLALWAIGAPAPMLFGLLSFLLNFVPTIGSVIAVLLPLPLLIFTDASVVTIVLALVIPGGVQFAVGQIWENKLLGDAFDLRASVVLLALVFWGNIWGIEGMLLATPITAVLKTLMDGWHLTKPLAQAMGQGGVPNSGQTPDPTPSPGGGVGLG